MNIVTTTKDLKDIEAIKVAISEAKNDAVRGLLSLLLESKQRELELANKLAKKTSTKKSDFTDAEAVLKSVYVAVRPHVDDCHGHAAKVFDASVIALGIKLTTELQEKIFATSTVHCVKSNFNKPNNNIDNSYKAYVDNTDQAKVLLPGISNEKWDEWKDAVGNAALSAATRRAIEWTIPAETVPAETVPAETVPAETVPSKKQNKKNKK